MNSRTRFFACCTFAAALMIAFPYGNATAQTDMCYECHSGIGDVAAEVFSHSIHKSKKVSCADCHGGDRTSMDMDIAMNKAKGFVAKPKREDASKLCVACHGSADKMKSFKSNLPTDQYTSLKKSVHGSLSGEENTELVMECTHCHGNHDVRRVTDPASPVYPTRIVALCSKCHSDPAYMRDYNPSLPTDQLAKYRTSVHGMKNAQGDTKVATCVNCHGAHNILKAAVPKSSVNAENLPYTCGHCHSNAQYMKPYGIPTDQVSDYKRSVHGIALMEKHDAAAPSCNDCHSNHGAVPPGIEAISHVCGNCHPLNAELFRSSPHKKAFRERNLPECETCHNNHLIRPATAEMLSVAKGSICGDCHSPTQGQKGYAAAQEMNSMLDSLMRVINRAETTIHEAEQKGMEVDDIRFALRDARQARLQSRTTVHSFDIKEFHEVIDKGIGVANTSLTDAQDTVEDYFFRRWGLLISTFIITFLAIMLYMYLKRIERRQKMA